MNHILFALLFFLPAGIANSAPPVANKIPGLNKWKTPMDFGRAVNGKRMFGKNKTWRGLTAGIIMGGLTSVLIYPHIGNGYGSLVEHFLIGASLGLGALLGDALESYAKRQINIKSGDSWLVFDQIDYVVGAILFSFPFIQLDLTDYIAVVFVYFVMHFIISYFGYLLGFKPKPI